MPRGKKVTYALAEDSDGRLVPTPLEALAHATATAAEDPEGVPRVIAAGECFLEIITRRDGWLRVAGGDTDKLNYWKFKFSNGEHKGKYVMYVGAIGGWVEGVLGLYQRLQEVDAGVRKPVHDTFYDPR